MAFASVASCAPRLLVIALQRLGHVVVHHKADVRLVNAHAKGDGRHNDVHVLHEELVLDLASLVAVHPGVVGQSLDAVHAQRFRDLLHTLAAQTVHNAAFACVLQAVSHDLLKGVLLGAHLVEQVVPVEGRLEHHRVRHVQVLLDVQLNFRGGRGRQRHDGDVGDVFHNRLDAAVFWAEVVSPLGDAVRLVDRDKTDAHRAQERDVLSFGQALGGDIQELGPTLGHVSFHLLGVRFAQR